VDGPVWLDGCPIVDIASKHHLWDNRVDLEKICDAYRRIRHGRYEPLDIFNSYNVAVMIK
jgi:hypothetical protein